jgi:hypothetical protein
MTQEELDRIWEAGKQGKAGTDTTCETDQEGTQRIWKSKRGWERKAGTKPWKEIPPLQGNQ